MTESSLYLLGERNRIRRTLQFGATILVASFIWMFADAASVNAETIDWSVIPRDGGGIGWNASSPDGPATQSFVNIDGTGLNMSVAYSGNMWDNNSIPNVYGSTAPIPVEAFQKALRWTNNRSDTGGSPGAPDGPTTITVVFDDPIILNDLTVLSLSQIGSKYEWLEVRAYDADNNILSADQTTPSTYVPPLGNIETRPDSPHIATSGPVYLLRGTSPQSACTDDCGYDRLTFEFTSTPIQRVEVVHFTTEGELVTDRRSSGTTSVALEPIVFSVPAIEEDWGDAPDTGIGSGVGNYATMEFNNGPRHAIVDGLTLGSLVDAESDGQQSSDADGDDINPIDVDDEDGVIVADLTLTEESNAVVRAFATDLLDVPSLLYGWIDFNGNGLFELSERAQVTIPAGANGLEVSLDFGIVPVASASSTYARFRLSTDTNAANPTGLATDGEVEDYPVSIRPKPAVYDWGDAPDLGPGNGQGNYNTLSSDNGPSHVIVDGLTIGFVVDDEQDGQPTAAADGDDANPAVSLDDEDGVNVSDLQFAEGHNASVRVNATNLTSSGAVLVGWIDFDGNGVFSSNESTQIAVPVGSDNQVFVLSFGSTPENGVTQTYARFRLSTDTAAGSPVGAASDGEIEDYTVAIELLPNVDWGDAPDTGDGTGAGNYNTLANDNGPRHVIVDGLKIGAVVDAEDDGQPTDLADGDDATPIGGPDDEDGLVLGDLTLIEQMHALVRVHVTNLTEDPAVLYGWIDFNGNGQFEASERAAAAVLAGSNNVQVSLDFGSVPLDSVSETVARFRLSSDSDAALPFGPATDGEVEDYPVIIETRYDWGDAPDTGNGTSVGNYNTVASNNGPSHRIVDGLHMGRIVDEEDDGQPTTTASGDNVNPAGAQDDEDGVSANDLSLLDGDQAKVNVTVTNLTARVAVVYGWIDFNINGVFEISERASATVAAGTNGGIVVLDFGTVPTSEVALQTYARFRISTDSAAASVSIAAAPDGEVEDYPVSISPLPSAVDLIGFSAAQSDEAVIVTWQTAGEIDTTGFYVYRSTTVFSEDAVRINQSMVPSQGSSGGAYAITDESVVPGVIYHYWLVEVENDVESASYGPTSVTIRAAARQVALYLPLVVR